MKIHNYSPTPNKKIDRTGITHHRLGHDTELVVLDCKESDGFIAEGILCNYVFVGMCTTRFAKDTNSGELVPVSWTMVFHELNNKDLKRIGDRFKYCAPLIMLPYIESTEMPIEDWPRIFNCKCLTCDLVEAKEAGFERVVVKRYNGKIDHERLFMEQLL